jgi:PAS domain S-box-containing protein
MYVIDPDFRLVIASDGASKVFGAIEPLLGRDFAEALSTVWPKNLVEEVTARFRHCLATGESSHVLNMIGQSGEIEPISTFDCRLDRVRLLDGRDGVVCHFYGHSECEAQENPLPSSELLFRSLFDNAAVGVAQVSPDGHWQRVNQKFCRILGCSADELIGATIYDFIHPDDHAMDYALLQQFTDGEIDEKQVKKRYVRKDGSEVWVRVAIGCVRDRTGKIEYFVRVIEDISSEVAAEARQNLLIGELRHRVKNSLAIIQAMATQTMKNSSDMECFRQAFSGRLQAMAIAHDSIFSHDGVRADLANVIRSQLAPFGATDNGRLQLDGPQVSLEPTSVHGLGLVIHELATNASKYGAFSSASGVIEVTWDVFSRDGRRMVELSWSERNGPEVEAPERTGFGSRLIEAALLPLHGRVNLSYRPGGLYGEIAFLADGAEQD